MKENRKHSPTKPTIGLQFRDFRVHQWASDQPTPNLSDFDSKFISLLSERSLLVKNEFLRTHTGCSE